MDVETAKRAGRDEFGRLLAKLRRGRVRVVTTEKTDRFYRNLADYHAVDELKKARDLEVHMIKEREVERASDGAMPRFTQGLKALLARLYVENLGEEASKGMLAKARRGMWPSVAPFGYLNQVAEGGGKVIAPDPLRAPVVVELYERYASGEHTLKDLVSWCRDTGVLTRRTSTSKSKAPRGGRPLSKARIAAMLKDPFYRGEFTWKEVTYQAAFPALVSEALWWKAQDVREERTRRTPGRARTEDLLPYRGLITCGRCGSAVVWERKLSRGRLYVLGRCSRGKDPACTERYVNQKVVDAQLRQALAALHLDEDELEVWRGVLRTIHRARSDFEAGEVERLEAEATRLSTRITRATEAWLDGDMDKETHREATEKWKRERARARARVAALEAVGDTITEAVIKSVELAAGAAQVFEKTEIKARRVLLEFFFESLTWTEAGGLEAPLRPVWGAFAGGDSRTAETPALVGVAGPDEAQDAKWLPLRDGSRTVQPLAMRVPPLPTVLLPTWRLARAA